MFKHQAYEDYSLTRKVAILFEPESRRIFADPGVTLLKAAKAAGIGLRSECNGKHSCGKCRIIIVDQSNLTKILEDETLHLTPTELRRGYRLACCCSPIEGKLDVFVPLESRIGFRRIQVEGIDRPTMLDPAIRKVHLQLYEPAINDLRPDFERLNEALKEKGFIHLEMCHDLLQNLPNILRSSEWNVTATIWDNQRILFVEKGNSEDIMYGFSVDIGTSKIVGYLVDLVAGNVVNIQSIENPQIIHGEDIISRITYAITRKQARKELQKILIDAINTLLRKACQDAEVDFQRIYEIVVVGNTAMHHFLLGIQPKYLSLAPYIPAIKKSINTAASSLRLRANSCANVHFLPVIAGYVGADAVADVLASGICETSEITLLIDVGTNGEVFVGNQEDVVCCSCAAGPAFEGMHIQHGMKASTGAIERVKIDPDTRDVEYWTIDGVKPVGICGSGIVDAVAEMFKCGITGNRGGINRKVPTKRLINVNGEPKFVIAWKHETGLDSDITVSGRDIQEIQLAKAAIHAGSMVLIDERKLTEENLDQIYIAGAFGKYLNPNSARILGLVPDIPAEKIHFVGNTAIAGARMSLISMQMRKKAETLSKTIRYKELVGAPNFQKEFMDSIFIPHRNINKYPTVMSYFHK